jgi:hypothetical protein
MKYKNPHRDSEMTDNIATPMGNNANPMDDCSVPDGPMLSTVARTTNRETAIDATVKETEIQWSRVTPLLEHNHVTKKKNAYGKKHNTMYRHKGMDDPIQSPLTTTTVRWITMTTNNSVNAHLRSIFMIPSGYRTTSRSKPHETK